MHQITISNILAEKVPELKLYCIETDVVTAPSTDSLWQLVQDKCSELSTSLKIENISSLPAIRASRQAYKSTGKDPARYRLSAEALLRRAVKEKDLYRISNVVDLLNLTSISTGYSIGGYDASKIEGVIEFGIGLKDEPYVGIGRGGLNIEGLPVFRDKQGAFGTPTSDSERTAVNENTQRFLMIIIGFGNNERLSMAGEMAVELLKKYASASNLETKIIK